MTPLFGTSRRMVHARPGDRRRRGSFSEIPSGHQLRPQMTTAMTRPVRRLPARARAAATRPCVARAAASAASPRASRVCAPCRRARARARRPFYTPPSRCTLRKASDRPSCYPPRRPCSASSRNAASPGRTSARTPPRRRALVGLASQPAIDVLCRKRAPMKRSGSVANGNAPAGLAVYWNYEPKQSEKIGDAL